ncbi:MAG: GGDEF domain-containing protein [Candidatus Omnitrophica bacterium]|nr:GGDEF domain-containing protein [Candidatus Omnitrophota bacterium]
MRLTLRVRIIGLVALFAFLLIAAFFALLVTRQLQQINENNKFRARIGTFAAKGGFERILLSSIRTGEMNPAKGFQKLIPLLQEGQLAEEILVSDMKWTIVAASDESRIGLPLTEDQGIWATQAKTIYSPKNWFYARVNPGDVTFYAPITLEEKPEYMAILRYSLGNMGEAAQQSMAACVITALAVLLLVVPLALLLIQAILGPISELNRATKDIATGNLTQRVSVETEDELGELGKTFNEMSSALVAMRERAENANPLTKLPGNNVIHEEIEKRIKGNVKFVAVYSDLDNFKAFNDKYGIGAGDQAIKLTAKIMRESLKHGAPGDFLGHEGGDDFILLTTPEKAEAVTSYICSEFDKRVREFYSAEDKQQGYIVSKDREGNVKHFPIMTVSLAGVTNAERKLSSYAEVTNICAEIKKYAKNSSKTAGKSSFFLDRRVSDERNKPAPAAAVQEKKPAPPPAAPPLTA